MTKSDLERLELAGMIENLQEVCPNIGKTIYHAFSYYDIEAQSEVIAVYDISDKLILDFEKNWDDVKFRRLERD